jgi:hypothetical protein
MVVTLSPELPWSHHFANIWKWRRQWLFINQYEVGGCNWILCDRNCFLFTITCGVAVMPSHLHTQCVVGLYYGVKDNWGKHKPQWQVDPSDTSLKNEITLSICNYLKTICSKFPVIQYSVIDSSHATCTKFKYNLLFLQSCFKTGVAVCSPAMRKFYKPPLAALSIVLSHILYVKNVFPRFLSCNSQINVTGTSHPSYMPDKGELYKYIGY